MQTLSVVPPALSVAIGLALACISIIKGKCKAQNILFSLVILWWSLISAAFVFHQIHAGDSETILRIERAIHYLYVFVPVINLVFFHKFLEVRNTYLTILFVLISTVLCYLVPTPHYFTGLHVYDWGSIAAGGPASVFAGLYGMMFIVYLVVLMVHRLRHETNQVKRLKIRYVLVSILVIAVMQVLNLPAMNGIALYPVGNFVFIPLAIMAYGILQHRLMDIKSMLHVSLVWGLVTSLALLLNIVIYLIVREHLTSITGVQSLLILGLWFVVNYLYFARVQPRIDQLFNRRRLDLKKTGAHDAAIGQDIAGLLSVVTSEPRNEPILEAMRQVELCLLTLLKEPNGPIDFEAMQNVIPDTWFKTQNDIGTMLPADRVWHIATILPFYYS